jgi:tRNA(Ile2) C34 agmatinyltransferase TiaS
MDNTLSKHTALAIFQGLRVPKVLEDYGLDAKKRVLTVENAEKAAMAGGVEVVEITGRRGMIGAVEGVGCFDMGLKAAMIPEDWQ